jgi:3-oxoacyl-[acyl-carrier protein] reductase
MRLALVTGGAGAIGLAAAKRLARDGLRIIISDLDAAACERALSELDGAGHSGSAFDVSNERQVVEAFQRMESEQGPISVVAHFAGYLGDGGTTTGRTLANSTVADWNKVMAVNALGTFLCLREYARYRRTTGVTHGRVITISSMAGQTGGLQSGVAYSASKAAVLGIMRAAARDLAPLGITVNAIAPGPIDTPLLAQATGSADVKYSRLDMVPLGRVGLPDEIAAAASFLASVDAGYVTGATIDVNGGILIR